MAQGKGEQKNIRNINAIDIQINCNNVNLYHPTQTPEVLKKKQRAPAETKPFHELAIDLTSSRRLATFQICRTPQALNILSITKWLEARAQLAELIETMEEEALASDLDSDQLWPPGRSELTPLDRISALQNEIEQLCIELPELPNSR